MVSGSTKTECLIGAENTLMIDEEEEEEDEDEDEEDDDDGSRMVITWQ